MTLTQIAAAGFRSVQHPPLQSGRGVAELSLALVLFAAVTTLLAHRGIGGLSMRLARWVALLLLAVAVVLVFL